MRSLLRLVVVVLCGWGSLLPVVWAGRIPNILMVVADDQGWGDLSSSGNPQLATPHLDGLARDGAKLERFYVCPVCAPTRAELLTGRWHLRGGVHDVSRGGERLNADEETVAQVLSRAGYVTGAFGKWHNGTQWPHHPRAFGFGEFCGFTSGHWGTYFDAVLESEGKPVVAKGYLTDDLVGRAMDFVSRHRERPFFCYLAMPVPHSPMQVPEEAWRRQEARELTVLGGERSEAEKRFTKAALAMCEHLDAGMGRLLGHLDGLGLREDTLVIYCSDNGPNNVRWNGGMRGIKGSVDEGGVRSVCYVRWPRRIAAGTVVRRVCGAVDVLPTIVEAAGLSAAPKRPLDGRSVLPLLLDPAAEWEERPVFSHWNGKTGVRSGRWRLDAVGRLYDMEVDPGQTRDVAAVHAEVAGELRRRVGEWRREMGVGRERKERPFPVGYREFPVASLPARDGVPEGGVVRSARAPNCSYFPAWRETGGKVRWVIALPESCRLSVSVAAAWVASGAEVVVRCGPEQLSGKLTGIHDPPLTGAENDRVPRAGESYMKAFREVPLGEWRLPGGRQELELTVVPGPGGLGVDIGGVTLTWIE
jgi:arylsulfatase A-like enzyme